MVLGGSQGCGTWLGCQPRARDGAGPREHSWPGVEEWGFCAAYQDGGSQAGCTGRGSTACPPGRWLQSGPSHGEDFEQTEPHI